MGMATITDAIESAAATPVSFEEFEQMPEEPGKQELLEGELIKLPPPVFRHNKAAHEAYGRLKAALDEAHSRGQALELGAVYIEMGYRIAGRNWLQPDVSVTFRDQVEGKYLQGAPAIAIEIISESNRAVDVDRKLKMYFQHGALEVWHLYRQTRRFVVHVANTARVVSDDEALTTPLLPGFTLRIQDILG